MKVLFLKFWSFINFLRLWKSILYGDISYYHAKPDGSDFLTLKESFLIAWIVWIK